MQIEKCGMKNYQCRDKTLYLLFDRKCGFDKHGKV